MPIYKKNLYFIVPEMQTKIMQTCSRLIDMTHPKIPQITG